MRPTAAKFVPSLLSDNQKEYRVSICTDLKGKAENASNNISNTITGDESWMFGYYAESKHQSSQCKFQLHHDRRKHDKFEAMSNQC
jgi:hypothetical protein